MIDLIAVWLGLWL